MAELALNWQSYGCLDSSVAESGSLARLRPARGNWSGLSADMIDRCVDVMVVDGKVPYRAYPAFRQHLFAIEHRLRTSGATLLAARNDQLFDVLVGYACEDVCVDTIKSMLDATRHFYGYLCEMGFRDDDPTFTLERALNL